MPGRGHPAIPFSRVQTARDTIVEPIDLELAKLAGSYCGRAGTSDVIDATVVSVAHQHQAKVDRSYASSDS